MGQTYLIGTGSSCSLFWDRLAGRSSSASMHKHSLYSRALSALDCVLFMNSKHNTTPACKGCPRSVEWGRATVQHCQLCHITEELASCFDEACDCAKSDCIGTLAASV